MWLLIDGNNWFARDYFASGTAAATTFLRRLSDIRGHLHPERVAILWDTRSFRHDLASDYKAGRGEKPPGFGPTMHELRDQLAIQDVASFSVDGFEADDLIATLARQAIDEGCKAMIFSNDRDLHQCLVGGCINQITAMRRVRPGEFSLQVMTAAKLKEQFGVHPHQWVDYRALVGDTSDGIKGCYGIGEGVARSILERFTDLERFYKRPFEINLSPSQRTKLLNFREKLPDVRRLLRLVDSAPLPATWLERIPL